jgi:hypothetical protein
LQLDSRRDLKAVETLRNFATLKTALGKLGRCGHIADTKAVDRKALPKMKRRNPKISHQRILLSSLMNNDE